MSKRRFFLDAGIGAGLFGILSLTVCSDQRPQELSDFVTLEGYYGGTSEIHDVAGYSDVDISSSEKPYSMGFKWMVFEDTDSEFYRNGYASEWVRDFEHREELDDFEGYFKADLFINKFRDINENGKYDIGEPITGDIDIVSVYKKKSD